MTAASATLDVGIFVIRVELSRRDDVLFVLPSSLPYPMVGRPHGYWRPGARSDVASTNRPSVRSH